VQVIVIYFKGGWV